MQNITKLFHYEIVGYKEGMSAENNNNKKKRFHTPSDTHSFVISPFGPVAVTSFGSKPWVSKMCRAAGLRRKLKKRKDE